MVESLIREEVDEFLFGHAVVHDAPRAGGPKLRLFALQAVHLVVLSPEIVPEDEPPCESVIALAVLPSGPEVPEGILLPRQLGLGLGLGLG